MSKPFEAITWGQYLGIAFAVVAIYYLYVAAAYYRVEILALLKGKGRGGAMPVAAGPAVALPSLMGGSGTIISKAALGMQPPAIDEKAEAQEQTETSVNQSEGAEDAIEEIKNNEPDTDNVNDLSQADDEEFLPGPQQTDSDDGFTVGVAQLSDYFEDAAEGNITQEELVAQMPELDNSALLVAFFQSSAKAAQQLTAQYYVDVPEPILD